MKKILVALGALVSIAIVILAGGIIFVATFDPNENKEWLAQKFNEATGRDLTLGGDLQLTIYPWLGITLNDASISNAEGFSDAPMLDVDHAEVRIKLLPLLNGEYEIDTVKLRGARINLETAGNGVSNWDDLSSKDASSTEAASDNDEALVKNIILGGVAIEDTSLVYDNQSNNTHYELNNLAATIGELIYGEPLRIAMSMDLLSRSPQLASNVNLEGIVVYDLDNGLYYLNPLTLRANLNGPDVPSGSTDITLTTGLSMNVDEDTLTLDNLVLNALSTRITANVNARQVQTSEPVVAANLTIAGTDLAAIFRILEQDQLAQRIGALNNTFNIAANVDANMETGVVMVPALQASLLGADVSGKLQAAALNTDEPSVMGNLRATGPDLPTLVEVVGILQGGRETRLAQIGRQLTAVPDKNFAVQTSFDADMDSGELTIPELSIAMFGATMSGNLTGSRINTETPALQGQLAAEGPDLPLLMQIAGQLQGGVEASLNQYGERLGAVRNRGFRLTTDFNADLQNGNVRLPSLNAELLGFKLNGTLDAKNMQANNGSINGSLALTGESLGEVLTALDQPELADVAQSMSMNLEVSGNSNEINISPLSVDLVVAGTQIPDSPQTLALDAETVVNLGNDGVNIDNFTLAGLGLNVSGNLAANNFSSNMSYEGEITVAEFNARNILEQLNQTIPETADPTVLQKVGLAMAFKGSANAFDIGELTMALDDTAINGTFAVNDITSGATRFTLDVDGIDADRYLPPASDRPEEATPEEYSPLEVEKLKELDLQGSLNIGQLTISGLKMTGVAVAMNAKEGVITLNPGATLYDGTFKSDMSLNVAGAEPTATVNTTLSTINLGPLLQDFMDATYLTGMGNIQLSLAGQGADIAAVKRNLNGNGSIGVENGVLTGVNVSEVLASIETMIRSKRVTALPQGGETAFSNFSSTLDIRNGIVSSNDLLIKAPGWKVNGAGTLVDLSNDTINYNLIATVEPATATTNDEQFDIGGYELPIACKGSIDSPSCLPDAQQIIRAAVTNEVQQRIGDFIQDRLGGTPQQQQQPPDELQPQEDDAQPTEEEPSVEEQLINRALDRLFR